VSLLIKLAEGANLKFGLIAGEVLPAKIIDDGALVEAPEPIITDDGLEARFILIPQGFYEVIN
jgi:hypothetical protein